MSDKKPKILTPDGQVARHSGETVTERTVEREHEDESYVPVIIKRSDETSKHPDDVLELAIEDGAAQVRRPALSLFLSAISAGLILGFAAMAVAFAYELVPAHMNPNYHRLSMALVYPLGFIVCLMSGAQLFTEHTALAVYPFLDKRCTHKALLRLWAIVISGNLLGTAISSVLVYSCLPVTGNAQGYLAVAQHLIHFEWHQILISAVLAGWLMALGGWLIMSTPPSSIQILCIYIVTFLIGIGGLHHSIAGSAEVFIGKLVNPDMHLSEMLKFLLFSIIGNLIGGSFFVAILNYTQIKKTQNIQS